MSLVWINGQLVDKSEARVSVFDHGFLYGDGVWEHFRVFGGKLFRAESLLHRLFHYLDTFDIEIPFSQAELIEAIELTVKSNGRTESYVRVIATRGPGTLGPDPRKLIPQVFIIAEEYRPFPIELYETGLHASVWPYCATDEAANDVRSLSHSYRVTAKRAALRDGCLESILCAQDKVIGCIEGALFLVFDEKVRPIFNSLEMESMEVVIELANSMEIQIEEDPELVIHGEVTINQLCCADEVLMVGITCGVIALVKVSGKAIGAGTEGPITRRIREAYRKLTRGE